MRHNSIGHDSLGALLLDFNVFISSFDAILCVIISTLSYIAIHLTL